MKHTESDNQKARGTLTPAVQFMRCYVFWKSVVLCEKVPEVDRLIYNL